MTMLLYFHSFLLLVFPLRRRYFCNFCNEEKIHTNVKRMLKLTPHPSPNFNNYQFVEVLYHYTPIYSLSNPSGLFCFYFLRERGREEEREEKHRCGRETLVHCLLHTPHLGTEPTTQACAPTGNQMGTFHFAGHPTN